MFNIQHEIEVEVGDLKQEEWFPQVKFKKWNNESNFSMRLIPTSEMECTTDNFYEKDEENDYEFDIILKRKPAINIVRFSLRIKEANFFRQDELTEEEIKDECIRPDNVVGSYAVYGNKKNNKYKAGKICHIYRPKAIDAKNREVWCDLIILPELETATITIPQNFLDNAVYPIRIDPDFGYTTLGGSAYNILARSVNNHLNNYTATTGDTITSYTLGCHSNNASGTFQVAAYDQGGTSARLAAATSKTINTNALGWETTTAVSHAMANGVTYELATCMTAGAIYIAYDAQDGGMERDENNPLAATWSMASTRNYRMSIYATYTEAGGANKILINIGDDWKDCGGDNKILINIGDDWKEIQANVIQINIGDAWKTIL